MRILVLAASILALMPTVAMAQSNGSRTTAPSSSLIIAGTHTFNGFTAILPSAGRIMVFDSASAPSDGAVTPVGCWKVPAPVSGDTTSMVAMGNVPSPALLMTGIALVFSTGANCYTLVKANAEYMQATYN